MKLPDKKIVAKVVKRELELLPEMDRLAFKKDKMKMKCKKCKKQMHSLAGIPCFRPPERENSYVCTNCGYFIQHQEYFLEEDDLETYKDMFEDKDGRTKHLL